MNTKLMRLRMRVTVLISVAVLLISQSAPAFVHAVPGETIYTGGNTGLAGDDDYAGPINLGFNFDFYGSTYSSTYANINGTLNFSSGSSTYSNSASVRKYE